MAMTQLIDVTVLLPVIGILTVITNVVVEVLKKLTYNHIPTQFLAVAIAEGLTFTAYFAYIMNQTIPTVWYYHVAAFVVGLMVSYAAMFGFDTLKEALKNDGGDKDGK